MKTIQKTADIIEKLCIFVASALLLFISGAIFVQIIVRKLGGTLVWVDEMTRYSFVWLVMLGTVSIAHRGEHISITSFLDMLPEKLRRIVDILIYLIVAAFCAVMTYAYVYAIGNYAGVTFSVVTAIPMAFHYVLIALLMGLTTAASLLHAAELALRSRGAGKGELL